MENYYIQDPRYDNMQYAYCGRSGLMLSRIALGFWHNMQDLDLCRNLVRCAYDAGVTYYDLANNYGVPLGSAEENFGRVMREDMAAHRDEMIISSKAGHHMWPGPYGEWGSRKSLMASIDQSLRRMNLEYVDIFYSHRPDPRTPLEETMQALVDIVRSGKALYAGISKYPADMARKAYDYLAAHDTPCLVYQGEYNMLTRDHETEILPQAAANGVGYLAFSPLNQGLLTDRYLSGNDFVIPADSRMANGGSINPSFFTPEYKELILGLAAQAREEGRTISQIALRWILRRPEVTSVIVGASSVEQFKQNLLAVQP